MSGANRNPVASRRRHSLVDDEIFREPMTHYLFALLISEITIIAVFISTCF